MTLPALAILAALLSQGSADSLDQRLEETRRRLSELEARHAGASEMLVAIHEHLTAARAYYNRLEFEEGALMTAIARIDARAAAQESVRAGLSGSLETYILYSYSHRRFLGPEALFAPGGLGSMLRRETYLDYLARQAAAEIEILSASAESLDRYRDSLQVLHDDASRLRSEMDEIARRIVREEERQALLRLELGSALAQARDSADALEAERQRVAALVAGLRSTSTASAAGIPLPEPSDDSFLELRRGAIPWPARGELRRGFGIETHPVYGTQVTSDGISVATAPSAGIAAVGPGMVLYARDFLNMGQMVIVDHQDGYYTIYGRLGSVSVNVGDPVTEGARIGTAGTIEEGLSGYYFEIRRGGQPVNPVEYLE